jgi:O-antigen/teichoic acid export membrane protein
MLMSGRMFAFTIIFLVPIILVRIFSTPEFGSYRQFFLITHTLLTIVQLGFAESLFYFLPGNPAQAGRFIANAMLMLATIGLTCTAGLIGYSEDIAQWMGNPDLARYIPLIGVYLVFILTGTILETILLTQQRYVAATAVYAVSDLTRGTLLVVPALLLHSLEAALYGAVAFSIVRMAAACVYAAREFGSQLIPDRRLLWQQITYSLPFALAVLVEMLQENYHQFAVAGLFDVATFALYSVGCLQIPLVDFLATPTCNVMMIRMREESREGRLDKVLAIWHDAARKLALVFFPLVGLLLANAFPLITLLFTDRYAGAVPLFQIFSLSILGSAFQINGALRVFAQNRFLFLSNVARLTAIVVLINWFISRFDLIGPVLLTILGVLFAKTLALLRLKTVLRTTFAQVLPWKDLGIILILSMVAAIPSALLATRLPLPALLLLPISGAAFMATYCALLLPVRHIVGNQVFEALSQRIHALKPKRSKALD